MPPIIVKALAICAAHAIHYNGSPGCTVLTINTVPGSGYVAGYEPGYEYCEAIKAKVDDDEQKEKAEAQKQQAAADAPVLKAAAKALGVKEPTKPASMLICGSGQELCESAPPAK